jgi:uridylate kinase
LHPVDLHAERKHVLKYTRILLKLSGEAVSNSDTVFDFKTLNQIAGEIKSVRDEGARLGIVLGGGNIARGRDLTPFGLDRIQSDYMGMLATVINSMLMLEVLKANGVPAVMQSALEINTVTEGVVLSRTREYMAHNMVVIFAAGTGSPYFTTDSAAALRACEIDADVFLKATKVDGVYDKDPAKHKTSIFFPTLTYDQILQKRLNVMDMAAVSMCRDNRIPMIVFNIFREGSLIKAARGEKIGTFIKE